MSEVVEITGLFSSASLLRFSKSEVMFQGHKYLSGLFVEFALLSVLEHYAPLNMQTNCTMHTTFTYVLSDRSLTENQYLVV